MLENFKGYQFLLADNWFDFLNLNEYHNKPIKYLEIGCSCGANIISVAKTYGNHNDSLIYGIDPYEDYDDYDEYKSKQPIIYNCFNENIKNANVDSKIKLLRGYSYNEIHKFENEYFDIIYIDGNHTPLFVLEDAVLSFRKLKKGGFLIFDDYDWGDNKDFTTKISIDSFISIYKNNITYLGMKKGQVFIKKNN